MKILTLVQGKGLIVAYMVVGKHVVLLIRINLWLVTVYCYLCSW